MEIIQRKFIRKSFLTVLFTVFCFSSLNSLVLAAPGYFKKFDVRYEDQGITMNLQGLGLKSVFFMKAFIAGFYKEEGSNMLPTDDVAKRIEVEYFVKIPARKLQNYTVKNMKANISQQEFKDIQTEISTMANYFVDLKPGDRFSLTYIPEFGTTFSHNGEVVGVIQGKEFAKALFSVWIGEKPFDVKLKQQILGSGPDNLNS